jgi:dihydroxyacetone kinase-like protein
MGNTFNNADGYIILQNLISCIKANVEYLSEVDGKIADGDHGINMDKGFTITAKRLEGKKLNLTDGMNLLGDVLISEIGGSMGPIYGSYFIELGDGCKGLEQITRETFLEMYKTALEVVLSVGTAKLGDKTMLDAMIPAINAFESSLKADKSFADCLTDMTAAAKTGMESTKDMVAKIGRSARLGERSRGVLDAGAVSCSLIIEDMAKSIQSLMQ